MIASLRQRHRGIWLAIALLLPALAALAWNAHRPAATMERLPAELVTRP